MSIPTLADIDMTAHFPQLPPLLSPLDSDDNALGMVPVRIAPLIEPGPLALAGLTETVTETVLDMQLIIDYTLALARRTAARIQRGHVDYIEHPHQHPTSGVTCLRIEAADFRLLHHLVRQHNTSRVLTVHTRQSLSAYHLATVVCPWTSRGGGTVTPMLRGSVGIRLAVATAAVAIGEPPAWLDHLPAPVL